ncbi:carbonic anhydrase [Legionella sp.]|uniref:carbonic anhydrase n=1 Tax=Legionella sp. TaxID=459 RepID=UPI003CBCCD64
MLQLMKGIRYFGKNIYPQKKKLYDSLTQGQYPIALFITCSDSRIAPALITHTEPGDLFIVRNVGNIVPFYSSIPSGEAAAIEYALEELKIKDIIICGHSHCGAMKGLMTQNLELKLPAVAAWLTYAQPTLKKFKEKYDEHSPASLDCVTKENILVQIENLKTHPAVLKRLEQHELNLHAWFYDFESGEILIYNHEQQEFISFDKVVTQIFNSPEVLAITNSIVEEEAKLYLEMSIPPQTEDSYNHLMHLLNTIKLKGIPIIWDTIKTSVIARLRAEFFELCPQENDPRLTSLIEQCVKVKLTNLEQLQKRIMDSSAGYRQFARQTGLNIFKSEMNLTDYRPTQESLFHKFNTL